MHIDFQFGQGLIWKACSLCHIAFSEVDCWAGGATSKMVHSSQWLASWCQLLSGSCWSQKPQLFHVASRYTSQLVICRFWKGVTIVSMPGEQIPCASTYEACPPASFLLVCHWLNPVTKPSSVIIEIITET